MNLTKAIAVIIILAGAGIIVSAFTGTMPQMQVAVALAGIGFICLGLMHLKRDRDRRRNEEKYNEIIAKLEEIKQELEKKEESKGGVVIADVIGAGLKYYTEHMTKPKEEEEEKEGPTG